MKSFTYCRKSSEADDRQALSLESQKAEIDRVLGSDHDLEITQLYTEAFSAKAPGREQFNDMLARIERGEAECIIAWHPDRLARNSVDGGRIIHMLDTGQLKALRFCTYSFENSSQGKFMLQIMFGQSKYYSDSLSENVRRGQRTKIARGWQPGAVPLGYRNCRDTLGIVAWPKHFKVVRAMFDLVLSGHQTVADIHRIAEQDWAYLTPTRKKSGGTPLSRSQVYRILTNPFYAGYISWNGDIHPGKHAPLVTKAEFEAVQQKLGNVPPTRPQKHDFAYRGLFSCGQCGKAITAERKRKLSGREYTYYHCTRVHTTPRCTQPSLEERDLTQQVRSFLNRVHVPDPIAAAVLLEAEASSKDSEAMQQEVLRQHQHKIDRLQRRLKKLTNLHLDELIEQEEFQTQRQELRRDLATAEENLAKARNEAKKFEPARLLTIISNRAVEWFDSADQAGRRHLLKILSSNPRIIDKKALLEAAKPFQELGQMCEMFILRDICDDVRTPDAGENPELREALRSVSNAIDPSQMADLRSLAETIEKEDEAPTRLAA